MISYTNQEINEFRSATDQTFNSIDNSYNTLFNNIQNTETDLESENREDQTNTTTTTIKIPFNKLKFLDTPLQGLKRMIAFIKKSKTGFQFYLCDLFLMEATKKGILKQQFIINSESQALVGKIKILEYGNLYVFQNHGMSPKKCTNQEYFRHYLGSVSKANELKCHIPLVNKESNTLFTYSPSTFKNKDIIQCNDQFFEFYSAFKFQKGQNWSLIYKKELTSTNFLIKVSSLSSETFELQYCAPLNHVQAFQIAITVVQLQSSQGLIKYN